MASGAARKALNQTASSRVGQFFLSNEGKTVVRSAGLVVVVGGTGGYLFAHGFFKSNYKEQVQHYEHGFPVKPCEKLYNLRQQVLMEMDIEQRFHKVIRLYHNAGFDPYTIGSTLLQHGCDIGLPKHFAYDTEGHIEKELLQIDGKPIHWQTEDGELLAGALVLSDRAKKFIIAQQLALAQTYYIIVRSICFATSALLYQTLTIKANERFYGFYKPKSFRVMIYGVSALFVYGLWRMVMDSYNKYLEKYCDNIASSVGVEYALGGVEYYSKQLQRNIALRALMGSTGEKTFTQFGNYKELWFRQRHIPLTVLKENAEKHVEKYMSTGTNNANNNPHSSNVVVEKDTTVVEESADEQGATDENYAKDQNSQ